MHKRMQSVRVLDYRGPCVRRIPVKITISVVDANSGQVISQTTKNLSGLGDAGKLADYLDTHGIQPL